MIGLVDVGGGMRDIYGAGVLDWCMDHGIDFQSCIGVSAGAANISSYLAGQRGRNYKFYTEYAFRKEYMSFHNLVHDKSYIDLDYIYGTLSNEAGEYPLDYKKMVASGKRYQVVATDATTGRARYFTLEDMGQDRYDPVKASSCVPIVNEPYFINGIPYYDGGLSDPIPVNRAFRGGCDKVVLILTRPKDAFRKPDRDRRFADVLARRYPKAANRLAHRADTYNKQLELALSYEQRGKVLILAPKDISGMKTLKKDREAMIFMYQEGYADAPAIAPFLGIEIQDS